MNSPCRQFHRLVCLLGLSFVLSLSGLAQTNVPVQLSPAAQAALNKGIIAAKQQEWEIAIRSFQEVRQTAPDAPEAFYNLGLAESKLPGRELRAIAWFGAYLAAAPDAANAAAVKDKITELQIKNDGNTSRLIKQVQDAAGRVIGNKDANLEQAAELWAKAGDIAMAFKTTDLVSESNSDIGLYSVYKDSAKKTIATVQTETGDIPSALKTADLIHSKSYQCEVLVNIALAQIKSGDSATAQKTLASAQKTSDSIRVAGDKSRAQEYIARAQAWCGNIAGAQKTADLIQDAYTKGLAQRHIAEAQEKAGQAKPPTQPTTTVSDWLKKLDDDSKNGDCPLNTAPFLDLAAYLKSLPADDPQKLFDGLLEAAKKIVGAQNIISTMLKQQAKPR